MALYSALKNSLSSLRNVQDIMSSSHFPASNGQAERAMQIVKKLLIIQKTFFLLYSLTERHYHGAS